MKLFIILLGFIKVLAIHFNFRSGSLNKNKFQKLKVINDTKEEYYPQDLNMSNVEYNTAISNKDQELNFPQTEMLYNLLDENVKTYVRFFKIGKA